MEGPFLENEPHELLRSRVIDADNPGGKRRRDLDRILLGAHSLRREDGVSAFEGNLSAATSRGGEGPTYLLNTVPSSSSFLLPTWYTHVHNADGEEWRVADAEEATYLLVHVRRNQVVAEGHVAREDRRGGAARNLADRGEGEHRDC